jgi:two-component system NarL family response regulator
MSQHLSLRQEQVLSLIAQGKTDKEIASLLGISTGTVNCHTKAILLRLKASSRAHAVAIRGLRLPSAFKSVTIGNAFKDVKR